MTLLELPAAQDQSFNDEGPRPLEGQATGGSLQEILPPVVLTPPVQQPQVVLERLPPDRCGEQTTVKVSRFGRTLRAPRRFINYIRAVVEYTDPDSTDTDTDTD